MKTSILAAGLGQRMGGRPKAALQIGGTSLLERLAIALRGAGVDDIAVVLGPYPQTLVPLAQRCDARVLQAPPGTPLAASQRLAVQAHTEHAPGHDMLVLLADLPLLTSAHIAWLLEAWRQRPDGVQAQMPVVDNVRGHPLILSWQAVQAVAAMPAHQGIRDWLHSHPAQVRPLPTPERAYTSDLDTPEDVAALKEALYLQTVEWP
nr:NTP transferase domain-containing protein [uncultured Albidiferax sp.]